MEAIYNNICKDYDATRKADPTISSTLASLLNIQPHHSYLDIGCGTGNYTIALAKLGGHWQGMDQSARMLSEAREKSHSIAWSLQNVMQTDYVSHQFDGAICSLAIHHFSDFDSAVAEIRRILKPGANWVIFTSSKEQMKDYWLCKYFPHMMQKSCEQMPSLEKITETLNRHGFDITETVPFYIEPDLQDLFLYSGKHKPDMYLSEHIRNGISSFANFCSQGELNSGLAALNRDINSGEIYKYIYGAKTNSDYLFIKTTKTWAQNT